MQYKSRIPTPCRYQKGGGSRAVCEPWLHAIFIHCPHENGSRVMPVLWSRLAGPPALTSLHSVLLLRRTFDRQPVEVDGFASEDRMGLHLRNIAITRMGPAAMSCVHARFETYCGVRVMAVRCDPSPVPVYVRGPDESVEFYIRAGPSSSSLSVRDSHEYIVTRF